MRSPDALVPVLLVLACSGDDGASTTASTSGATTSSTSEATTGSTGASTGGTATTGTPLCNFGTTGDSGGGEGPWLELYEGGEPLVDGSSLSVLCGGQGSLMFEVWPVFGGFTPPPDYVHFEVILDVDGHNNGPSGHFYASPDSAIQVGCEEDYYGGLQTTFQLLLFDEVDNIEALHGVPGQLHVGFVGDGVSVNVDVNLTIDAPPGAPWTTCGGYGYDTEYGTTGDTTGGTTGDTGTSGGTTDATTGTSGTTGP